LIRIVGVQRNDLPEREFVVLQNQGALRVNLKGHMLVSDAAIARGELDRSVHVFSDDILIPAGMHVVLFSGVGEPRFCKSKDGGLLFYTYMNREESVWNKVEGPLHVLAKQHTYTPDREPSLMLR
jgi:hypothetical protein